ncbi:hypothetical protein GMI69_00895 [Eggerthellaceae bacterium zg-887]|uniref:hypothetical protein n=1 Tax=Xiamenia xianingshaonis TaxID=2682776 RepID=UPI00140BEEC5|nr:hypothetical protein [Xiamenia xianingshaonis]NHM15233.1 hypothetical protein [Xiamenia xianingshaonis]
MRLAKALIGALEVSGEQHLFLLDARPQFAPEKVKILCAGDIWGVFLWFPHHFDVQPGRWEAKLGIYTSKCV